MLWVTGVNVHPRSTALALLTSEMATHHKAAGKLQNRGNANAKFCSVYPAEKDSKDKQALSASLIWFMLVYAGLCWFMLVWCWFSSLQNTTNAGLGCFF